MITTQFRNIRRTILSELDKAEESISVAVYWFTNRELFDKLLHITRSGVSLELIIHNDYINNRTTGLPFQKIIDAGGKLYFSGPSRPMHNKFCVIDRKLLITGSYNWTYYAEDRNRENILVIEKEDSVINEFIKEFEELTLSTKKVEKIQPLSEYEIDNANSFRVREYLAHDILYEASAMGDMALAATAMKILPDDVGLQEIAVELGFQAKRFLKHSIGAGLVEDKYLVIIPKGTLLPVQKEEVVQTVEDNQTVSGSTIYYGENAQASRNTKLDYMKLVGLPKKPAGEAKMRYVFSIDVNGVLKMLKFSLDNGGSETKSQNISSLLDG